MSKKQELKSLISYFFVGGSAALVEWLTFWLSNFIFHYSIATAVSFLLATYFNYLLGTKFTFKKYTRTKHEMVFVFIVSSIGLLLNILLMLIFVDKINLNPLLSKILSTGIVFFWNYISRRVLIYKNKKDHLTLN